MKTPFNWYEWIKESSTIRGIIALATILGYGGARWVNAEMMQVIILGLGPLVYAVYNLVRSDSTKAAVSKAIDAVKDKLVTLVFFTLFLPLLLMSPQVMAADLVTAPMAGVATYDVDVDGAVVQGVAAEADGSLKYDVDLLPAGTHTFKVKPIGQGGWPADWSDPFSAVKPPTATGLIIVP